MADRIHYGGEWKWAKKVTDLLNEGGGGGASELDDLQDVTLIEPTTGQALVFDGTKWVNADVAGTQEQADWAQTDTTAVDYIKNKPTIPTVNDGTLTVKNGDQTKGTFTANQSSASNIVVLPFDIVGDLTTGFTPVYQS